MPIHNTDIWIIMKKCGPGTRAMPIPIGIKTMPIYNTAIWIIMGKCVPAILGPSEVS
jgi:hypothetical protein